MTQSALSETWRVDVQGGWQNRILARLSNEMSRYNPIHYVPQVKAPVLMVATTRDALCSIHLARRAASLNPLVKLVEKDAGRHPSAKSSQQKNMQCNAGVAGVLQQSVCYQLHLHRVRPLEDSHASS